MLFGIPWWAILYLLILMSFLYLEVVAWEEVPDEGDEKLTFVDKLNVAGLFIYYTTLFSIVIMFFQQLESLISQWSYLLLSLCVLPYASWYIFIELKNFIKDPQGTDDEGGESSGIVYNLIGHLIAISIVAIGMAFAIKGSLPFISLLNLS